MATTMHKLLRSPLQLATSPNLILPNPLNLLPWVLHHQPNFDTLPECDNVYNVKTEKDSNNFSSSSLKETAAVDNGFHAFPSFSFKFFLDPKLLSGFHQIEEMKAGKLDLDESQVMWADSVKKKRKQKMNKHKLRKLRKRLRGHA